MTNDSNSRRRRRILAALLGSTLLCGGVAIGFSASGAMAPAPISVPQPPKLPSFANLVTAVKPAVVNISTTQVVKSSKYQLPENGPLGDMLQQFLGPDWQKQLQQQSQQPAHALGSRVCHHRSGGCYIVTNNHVIDDASDIQVTLSDGTTRRRSRGRPRYQDRTWRCSRSLPRIQRAPILPSAIPGKPRSATGSSQSAIRSDWAAR